MTTLMRRTPLVVSGMGFGPLVRPFLPAADVYVSGGNFVIELEVPGFAEKELGIEVTGRTLTITGTHAETEGPEKAFRLHERLAEFERTFVLPPDVDVEKVTSTFADCVMQVLAPLPAPREARRVPITSA